MSSAVDRTLRLASLSGISDISAIVLRLFAFFSSGVFAFAFFIFFLMEGGVFWCSSQDFSEFQICQIFKFLIGVPTKFAPNLA